MKVRPFRAIRYNPERIGDLSKVVAPPYDQIDPATQSLLYAMHPQNIVRISFGQEAPGDDTRENRYTRAKGFLERWLAEGILAEDPVPALYPYHTAYRIGEHRVTRAGFVALGELSEYSEGIVLPHELTHTGPKEDRLRLLEATRADLGLVFVLYSDPSAVTAALLGEATSETPLAEASDLRGEGHRLWRVTEPAVIAEVQRLLADRAVIIADGHHRYETALEFRRTHPEATHMLIAFYPLEGSGLTILPNHRLIRDVPGFSPDRLLRALRSDFEIEGLADIGMGEPGEALCSRIAGPDQFVFIAAGETHPYLLTLRPDASSRIAWPLGTSEAWRRLSVSILHEGILRPHLGIGEEALRLSSYVDYTASADEAVRLVQVGRYQAAFLLAPVSPKELQAVVSRGELLPQKSTHFYPKLLTGLALARV